MDESTVRNRNPGILKLPFHVRWLIRHDVRQVIGYERHEPDAWTDDDILAVMRSRNAWGFAGVIKGEFSEMVIAHCLYTIYRKRFTIERLLVNRHFRRQGIGRTMVDRLRDKLKLNQRETIRFRIPERNVPAQLFLRSCGVKAARTVRTGTGDDVIIFETGLADRDGATV